MSLPYSPFCYNSHIYVVEHYCTMGKNQPINSIGLIEKWGLPHISDALTQKVTETKQKQQKSFMHRKCLKYINSRINMAVDLEKRLLCIEIFTWRVELMSSGIGVKRRWQVRGKVATPDKYCASVANSGQVETWHIFRCMHGCMSACISPLWCSVPWGLFHIQVIFLADAEFTLCLSCSLI